MERRIKIAPSVLAADFSRLSDEVKRVEEAGADLLHVDVMDGHFVPNITVGPQVIGALDSKTKLPLDVHLMIENPGKYIKSFAEAGADILTVHIEAYSGSESEVLSPRSKVKIKSDLSLIKSLGLKAGVVLNPSTPLSTIEDIIEKVNMVLLMTVNPGFGGQGFIRSVLPKIRALRRYFAGDIEVDGGINHRTAKEAVRAGANILVAGTYIFRAENMREAIKRLRL